MTVAAFNVLNYFTTLDDGPDSCGPTFDQECRGADSEEEFARQEAKIVAALEVLGADVVGLIEIQNNAGPVAALADALNAKLGANVYVPILTGPDGTDAIKVGLVYRADRVVPVGAPAVLDDPSFTNPNDLDGQQNRPALAQSFADLATGGVTTVVVNHFKSKGSDCGAGDDDPLAGNCDLTRTLAAQALAAWIASDPTGVGDADALVIGDINSYDEEDPIEALAAAGYTDLVELYEGEFAYSYVFDGQFGHLDYSLANGSLVPQVSGATLWHINADEPDILDYDTSFKPAEQEALYAPDPFRSSDHDPVLVGLDLQADPDVLLQALREYVRSLSSAGELNRGQARSLQAILNAVERSIARGRSHTAVHQLGAFQDHVRDLADDGVLGAADAHDLVMLADALAAASG
jgi:predicted extracellular nuclease